MHVAAQKLVFEVVYTICLPLSVYYQVYHLLVITANRLQKPSTT